LSSWNAEIERDNFTSCSDVMGEFRTRKRDITGDGGNPNEKLLLQRFQWTSVLGILDTAGRSSNTACNNKDPRSS
jgi:hypothetical protein